MDSIMKEFEHLVVKLEEVKSATDNFNDTKIIGKGGFGYVYEGELSQRRGKTKAAFKRLDRKHGQGNPEFWKEVMMLSRYTHENLISLLGYCNEGGEMILVYEHASNGSLDRHLSSTTLTWTQRIRICHDAAKGLCYLHEDKGNHHRVLHRDIKSSNILLDENWKAKISDMGLAKVGPSNMYTFFITTTVGTLGYIDPMYLRMGFLTKESDVYSFGVVLFEVLCGRLCFDYSNAHSGNIVHIWKQRYEENKLDEIVFKDDRVQALHQSSLEVFSEIAFQCLQESREKRPKMSNVVEKLEIALEFQEPVDLIPKEHEQIVKAVVPPLIYRSVEELKVLLSKGVLLNGGKKAVSPYNSFYYVLLMDGSSFHEFQANKNKGVFGSKKWLSINEKWEHIEKIYIEACLNLDETDARDLQHPSGSIVNSRFPGGLCYNYSWDGFKARVSGQFLTPQISYTLNLVFRHKDQSRVNFYDPLRYKIDGDTKVFIIYPTIHEREDGWFIVPLYHFTSQHTTADLQFEFEYHATDLLVAGIEFQPSEEKVELPVFEEYQHMVEAASQSLFYTSLDELKQILSKGVLLNGYKTWFSLNEKGEHCEMISIEDYLIPNEDSTLLYLSDCYSRFPAGFYKTNKKGFETHVKTQFLSPSITYTVNLVFYSSLDRKQEYGKLKYRLRGETTTSTVNLANRREIDYWLWIVELFQFNSDGSIVDLEIDFDDHETNLQVEGILFQPLEKWLSINEKGEHIVRISIEACLNLSAEIEEDRLKHPSDDDIVNSRFPGGRCYDYWFSFKARVRGEYLTTQISYTLNLVFRYKYESRVNWFNPLRYKIDGEDETKVFIIYPTTNMRGDGWFIVPLYHFTSQHKTADLQFEFEFRGVTLLVAGFEFQPSEEKVELPVFEEYQYIIEAASQSLFYRSLQELKQILSKGVLLNGYKTWFSINEKGEHCHMISMKDCLIPNEDSTPRYRSHPESRFPAGLYQTTNKGFKTHLKTQLLSPSITYTVNLVYSSYSSDEQVYVDLKYRLRGETTTSVVYLANRRQDDLLHMAELFQFTGDGSIVDLEIDFDDHGSNLQVEGILFQPLEKVEDQVSKDDKAENIQTISDSESDTYWEQKFPNDYEEILNLSIDSLRWTTKKELYSILRRGFLIDNGQQWFSVDKHGKKCLMLSAKATWVIDDKNSAFESSHESRFGEVLVVTAGDKFELVNEIKPEVLLADTTYASYFVYKLPQDQSTFEDPLKVKNENRSWEAWFVYLVSPSGTPIIKPKFDENSYNPLNRHKLNALPRLRSDGWMEVKVWQFYNRMTPETVSMHLKLEHPVKKDLSGLIIHGIELRPI